MIPAEMFISPNKKWTFDELRDPRNMLLASEHTRIRAAREAMPQVYALLAAGWTFEVVHENCAEPWQWAWRRPAKKPGKEGRRFASTNQAYNALMKEKATP